MTRRPLGTGSRSNVLGYKIPERYDQTGSQAVYLSGLVGSPNKVHLQLRDDSGWSERTVCMNWPSRVPEGVIAAQLAELVPSNERCPVCFRRAGATRAAT